MYRDNDCIGIRSLAKSDVQLIAGGENPRADCFCTNFRPTVMFYQHKGSFNDLNKCREFCCNGRGTEFYQHAGQDARTCNKDPSTSIFSSLTGPIGLLGSLAMLFLQFSSARK